MWGGIFCDRGKEVANLIMGNVSVGWALHLPPALVPCPWQSIFKLMILYRAADAMFHLNLKSDLGVHRVRPFLKWLKLHSAGQWCTMELFF